MKVRKKMLAYKGDERRNFILLWVEENIGIRNSPAVEPYYFEPTKKELKKYSKGAARK